MRISWLSINQGAQLDANGGRFLLAFLMWQNLRSTAERVPTPASQPLSNQQQALGIEDVMWAAISSSEEDLLKCCFPSGYQNQPWPAFSAVGVCYWVKGDSALRAIAEGCAKVAFSQSKNPDDCALFYVALGKLPVLAGLYQMAQQKRVADTLR